MTLLYSYSFGDVIQMLIILTNYFSKWLWSCTEFTLISVIALLGYNCNVLWLLFAGWGLSHIEVLYGFIVSIGWGVALLILAITILKAKGTWHHYQVKVIKKHCQVTIIRPYLTGRQISFPYSFPLVILVNSSQNINWSNTYIFYAKQQCFKLKCEQVKFDSSNIKATFSVHELIPQNA